MVIHNSKRRVTMKTFFSFVAIWLILVTAPTWASTACIGKDKVNVRASPSLTADVLFQAHLGYPVEVAKSRGDWVQVKDWEDNVGWIHKPLLNRDTQTAVVLPERVNVRKGPGLKYQVVNQAQCGEVYKVFAEKKGWVKIGYYRENQEIGWIRNDLVWGN
jgi:uncharacterized protein YgiM (DUF1202 family)